MALPIVILYFILVPVSVVLIGFAIVEIYRGHQADKQSERTLQEIESLLEPQYRIPRG